MKDTITYGSGNGAFTAKLGEYQPLVEAALESWDRQRFSELLWAKDPTPWKQPPGTKELVDRLGWLTVADTMINRLDELTGFAREIRDAGFTHVVVLGMGGSSLSPEVSARTFGSAEGFPKLLVLDSTIPADVLRVESAIDIERTLFIVSSKSGSTIETKSAYRYFFPKAAPEQFVAITDPGSWLEQEAGEKGFRRAFINMPDIGGRYSALSYFGLLPAALIGVDVAGLLESARKMMEACGPAHPARNNPAVALGAIMAECAMRGRDKMTIVFSPELKSLGCWIEQLVAESTGKNGQGILPVEIETPFGPDSHGSDRLLVYTKVKGTDDHIGRAAQLTFAGRKHPAVTIEIDDLLDLGGEYFRWEMATAVASALLAVHAFDQQNVASSKSATARLLDAWRGRGEFPAQTRLADDGRLTVYADDETAEVLNRIREGGPYADATVEAALQAHLQRLEPGNYVAVMAFVEQTPDTRAIIDAVASSLADHFKAAVTVGYGPRFLHSTGQFHKGGPNTGLFIQLTADDPVDVQIPGEDYSFAVLKDAQALGDFESLREKGCRVIRIHLGADLNKGLASLMGIVLRITGAL